MTTETTLNEFASDNDGVAVVMRMDNGTIWLGTGAPGVLGDMAHLVVNWDWYFTNEPESFPYDEYDISRTG